MILIFKGYNNLSYLNSVDDLLNQQKQVKREMNEREREIFVFQYLKNEVNRKKKLVEKKSRKTKTYFFCHLKKKSKIIYSLRIFLHSLFSFG